MKFTFVILIVVVVVGLRLWIFTSRRRRAEQADVGGGRRRFGAIARPPRSPSARRRVQGAGRVEAALGDVGLVAGREIRERIRGRIFRVGTLLILVVVALAIIIPTLHHGSGTTTQTVALVGPPSPATTAAAQAAGKANLDTIKLLREPSLARAKADLRSGRADLAVVGGSQILLNESATESSSPADNGLVQTLASYLGVLKAYHDAGLTASQISRLGGDKAVPVRTLKPASKAPTRGASLLGLVLL
ncbi:MAG: hypothetical protein ACRDY1_09415, partial [Acidimicrobiales bacterium]